MATADVNQAAEDLNRALTHVHDEINRRIERARGVKGDKDTKSALSAMQDLTKSLEKIYDDTQDFLPTEKETAAAEESNKSSEK